MPKFKKYYEKFAFIALAAFLAVSCSDDDTANNNNNNSNISGTWELTAVTSAEPLDANDDGVSSTDFMAETGCFNNSDIIFETGNTATMNLEVPFFGQCFAATTNGTWEQTGNTITFITEDEDGEYTTEGTLSGDTLTIETPYEVTIETNNGSQTTSFDVTLVYTKQ